jgi:photosystem II stability/assembly factor-like uncharacterized protein
MVGRARFKSVILLTTCLAISGCGTGIDSPSAGGDVSPTTAPTVPGHQIAGRFGSTGSALWLVSEAGLSTSDDGGLHWQTHSLPAGVTASAIADAAWVPERRLWIAVPSDEGVHLYGMAMGSSSWSDKLLIPTWPSEAGAAGPAGSVEITPGPGGLLTVAATVPGGTDVAFSSLFLSTDDGQTFVEHPASPGSPANVTWNQLVFADPQSGVVVGGTSRNTLLHTSDGGTSWTEVSATGAPTSGSYYLGNPVVVDADIEVPLIALPSNGKGVTLSLLLSHDGGATFAGSTGSPLDLGTAVNPALASYGKILWAAPAVGGQVYETADEGRTWTSVAAASLPSGVSILVLTSATSATALIGLIGCQGFVPNCWTSAYLVDTTDGGRTWTAV